MKNVVFMKCTTDKYELPIYTADTVDELSKKCGVSTATIYSCICKDICGYKKVILDKEN